MDQAEAAGQTAPTIHFITGHYAFAQAALEAAAAQVVMCRSAGHDAP